jgi:DNA repair ATPase RecN
MAVQCKKFSHFTSTHKAVVDLYHRLKELQDPTLDDLEYALQKILTECQKLVEDIESNRTEEFEDLMREIAKLSKKVQIESDQVDTRLDNFMKKLSDTDNDDAVSEMDQVFLKKEVNKLRSATTTIHSISVNILEEVFKVKKIADKRPDKLYTPEDISALK